MSRRLVPLIVLVMLSMPFALPARAVDVIVESGACEAALSKQQVANAGVTRRRDIQGTNILRRYVGLMRWQGDLMVVGVEVHRFTCTLKNIVAPVTRETPVYGRYARLGGFGT